MITILITALMTGILCCVCFLIGAKVGQKVSKGEAVELPSVNPINAIKNREQKKQTEAELKKIYTIMHNIDSYDGTPTGQKDVN